MSLELKSAMDYFRNVAKPMRHLALQDPSSVPLACAATVTVFSTADWIAHERDENHGDIIRKITEHEPDFEYLHAASNALKHREIKSSPKRFIGLTEHVGQPQIRAKMGGKTVKFVTELPDGRRVIDPVFFNFEDRKHVVPYILITDCLRALWRELGLRETREFYKLRKMDVPKSALFPDERTS